MARTKSFSGPPPGSDSDKSIAAPKGDKSVTKERFVNSAPETQLRGSAADAAVLKPQGPAREASAQEATARSTLIMKPGHVARASSPASTGPKRRFGLPSGGEAQMMIMSQEEAVESMASQRAPHPVSQSLQPPEIELVVHEMPRDVAPDPRLILLNEPDSERAAAFRVLRHHIMERGNPQVIAVSGPRDGCGKTTTAINLALALAECGRAEVLLVDANLRNPKIAALLRFVPPRCVSEQLESHLDQPFSPWSFVNFSAAGLHVAAINPRLEHQPRLHAQSFGIAMDRLRLGPYRHIVIDCPSILGNADVNLIQDATDGVLLAARTKRATTRDIRNAIDQLTPTKILGTTLFES